MRDYIIVDDGKVDAASSVDGLFVWLMNMWRRSLSFIVGSIHSPYLHKKP